MDAFMSSTTAFEPPPDFIDPRRQPDFLLEHWPLCNGQAAPPADTCDLHERRCLEFLGYFYQLNLLNSQLFVARTASASSDVLKSLLAQIATVTQALESLEDRYAPIGFFGDPIMEGFRYSDIVFVRPELPRIYPNASALSSCIAIPGLDEIPASELQGTARILRFGHGKMDF